MMRLCSGVGCGRAIPEDQRYCDECAKEHAAPGRDQGAPGRDTVPVGQADRDKFAAIYGSKRWRTLRRDALQAHPWCTWPGCHAPATMVDHIVPLGEAIRQVRASKRFPIDQDAGAYLLSNLTGMCAQHHGDKTALDKAHQGEWPDVLAIYDATPRHKFIA
jgi:hypothetical protein